MMTNMVKTSLLSLKIAVTSLLLLTSINAMAVSCIDVFPTVLSSPDGSGDATLNWEAAMSGTVEGNLNIGVVQNVNSPPSCDGYTCKDSGGRSQFLTGLDTFKSSPLPADQIPNNPDVSAPLTGGSYDTINVGSGKHVRFQSDDDVIYIETLNVGSESSVTFQEGVYWINEFKLGWKAPVVIKGKVTLIINEPMITSSDVPFNVDGTSNNLLLIGFNNITFGSNVKFNGLIYSKGNVVLNSPGNLKAPINGTNITVGSQVTVAYDAENMKSTNFDGFCSVDDSTLKTPIFSPSDGILGGQLKGQSNGTKFHIGKAGNGNNQWPSNEGPEHLIDDEGQKYLNFGKELTGAIITPAIGCSVVDTIKFWTANDFESRDPASYKLYGTNTSISDTTNPLSSFTLLAEGPLALPSLRNSGGNSGLLDTNSQTISFTNSSSYSSYLLYFPTVKTERSANSMQLAEVQVFGTARSCAVPVLEYRFDEASWNGTSNEVIDSSPNNNNGTAKNHLTTLDSAPAITGSLGTCSYGEFDGINDYVAMGSPASLNFSGEITLAAWIRPDSSSGLRNIISHGHRRSPNQEIIFRINGGNYQVGSWNGTGHITSSTIPAGDVGSGNWVHLAGTYDGTTWRLYRNGVEISATADSTGAILVSDNWAIGARGTGSERFFDGGIDEPRIYSETLNATQISALMNEKRTCPTASIHHYEIQHDGHGLTCEPESITVKACTNETCTTLSAGETSLDVTATGTNISVTDSIKFTGTGTASIRYTLPESTLLSLSKEGTNSTRCSDGFTTSCNLAFANAGFRFMSANSTTIPNQKSGTEFGETLKIQAVKDTKGVCTGLFSGTRNIDLSQENVDPGGSKGLRFSVDGDNIAKHSSVTSTALSFSSNSIAVIPKPLYNDAGKIRLHANYIAGQGEYNGVTLFGSSNAFWVSPAKLVVNTKSGSTNLNGATATATPIHAAGDDFTLKVTAENSLGVITPNYSPGQIQLKLTRTAPTSGGSVDGDLTYAETSTLKTDKAPTFQDANLTSFSLGISTYNEARYSEVGLINLDVQDSNYGGTNIVVGADAIDIGRFTPDHFKQTLAIDVNGDPLHGVLDVTCGSDFAYSGQMNGSGGAISYVGNPTYQITANNKQGIKTENYTGDYMKLSPTDVDIITPLVDKTKLGDDQNLLALTANITTGTLTQISGGVLHYTFSNADNFVYNRGSNAQVAPFTSEIVLAIDDTDGRGTVDGSGITDSDGVNLKPSDGSSWTTTAAEPSGVDIRFGRLVLKNSFGPATSNLPQPLQVEYFDGINFVISSDDTCTRYDDRQLTSAPSIPVFGGQDFFVDGESTNIYLDPPAAGHEGDVDVIYVAPSWLQYDWITDGEYTANPTAVATFGLFRGNDRVIYKRRLN